MNYCFRHSMNGIRRAELCARVLKVKFTVLWLIPINCDISQSVLPCDRHLRQSFSLVESKSERNIRAYSLHFYGPIVELIRQQHQLPR